MHFALLSEGFECVNNDILKPSCTLGSITLYPADVAEGQLKIGINNFPVTFLSTHHFRQYVIILGTVFLQPVKMLHHNFANHRPR